MSTDKTAPVQFINREISLLEFQRRVLEEAQNESNPLLERVKFLSIFGTNMDEFFMVRVSGIRRQVEAHILEVFPDGLNPTEVLAATRKLSLELYEEALHYFNKKIRPSLDKSGIHLLEYDKLSEAQKKRVNDYFKEVIYPVLTPLAFDPGHPFPHISNLSLNLAVVIKDEKGKYKFARIKVPDTLPRLLPIKRSSGGVRKNGTIPYHHYFVWLEQVIKANISSLFPGMKVVEAHPFRIIRDADMEIQEIEADDLLQTMQQSILKRKFGSVVQVSINQSMPEDVSNLLIENLEINSNDVYVLPAPLGLGNLWMLATSVERDDLKFPPYKAFVPKAFQSASSISGIFEAINQKNILLHQPYDSFNPVVDFLFAAARDPQVLAIKQTIYRIGKNAGVIEALLEAAGRGKEVAVLMELKARFDEESNIGWAHMLEHAGVHVVYGLDGLKTHCKIIMVVRQEGEGICRYIHLSTGNYNAVTSLIYEDIGMFTCDEAIGEDATALFNYLTGYSSKQDYQKLFVAPVNLRQKLEALILREIAHAKDGMKAHLILKTNSLVDPELIKLLYEASHAGVKVDLLVRGISCLQPGVKGMSDRIRVISIVGRFLEHSRVYYFLNNGKEEVYLSSADIMPRNLDRRVELMFPVEDPTHVRYLHQDVLENYFKDNSHARVMGPDGSYTRLKPLNEKSFDVQDWLMRTAHKNSR
ncbi:MAG TPA: polyphosphate kinase 1 [Anaerolineales bacterium]